MNKYQEALIYFCNGCHHEYEEGNYGQCKRVEGRCGHYKSLKEACDKAEKYDEKETPKKVKAEIMSDYVEHHYVQSYEIYVCPVCGLHLSPTQNYCDRCSQKLDWSDEDDK